MDEEALPGQGNRSLKGNVDEVKKLRGSSFVAGGAGFFAHDGRRSAGTVGGVGGGIGTTN
jgi:hypothetical protein